ncbi:hypothetical protein SS1G_07409 [Sclerotinia sclerotiorum 1980 UF-70]|uniref:DUF3074 domain-containing protein n=2 Tax=Sclerotinia sclerotiorum (strain ATCC 18683 / 1980 / Ss-1) TaxID=665079 RepID=A7EQ09_SCLS1|nr:hypothetical protein SS1G_07409 [Sclerotinia sclerotiorum 1980 UF-70]APA10169.1 hypothetical protein sscle_06g049390 [Sclerotinia sclerotiorum 1980 UF-70]EDO04925.1 hypothetical protein SS1G_07409 [Sclerotinia sclerotiorum 1980 UF-70]
MAALHDALKALGAIDYDETPTDNLKPFLLDAFNSGQIIVDSIPIPDSAEPSSTRPRSNTTPSIASSASEILASHARSPPPPHDIECLQKEWKQVKLKPADNPLGISVYSCKGRDGKGTWFARRSVHEGLGFTKWKRGLEREFPETLKVQGGPGEGNIRGIGGEKRVAYNNMPGTGKMEVYLLSAQFPGPTSPRDFVTMLISSDQALRGQNNHEIPRHFMVISKPCQHPDAPQREGYIRGNYESVEFIREIPTKKAPPKRSVSASDLTKGHSRDRSGSNLGREAVLRNAHQKHDQPTTEGGEEDIERQASRSDSNLALVGKHEKTAVPSEDDEWEQNPVEWIMITRSDPGGSVPRFMIDRGTPSAIVSDAGKFLDWACSKTIEELDSDDEEPVEKEDENTEREHHHRHHRQHDHEKDLHNYQTNGHLAGIDSQAEISPPGPVGPAKPATQTQQQVPAASGGGIYDLVAGVATSAGALIAPYAPAIIADRLPHANEAPSTKENEPLPLASEPVPTQFSPPIPRSRSVSDASITSESTVNSFESALSFRKISSQDSAGVQKVNLQQDKELQKLEDKKRKLQEKLERAKQREADKKSEDGEKEKEAIRKAEEKYEREVRKREEKYRKEMEKLEKKRIREGQKQEERKRKREGKEKGEDLQQVNANLRAEIEVLKREKQVLRDQVGSVQRENTLLVGRLGRLGVPGEEMLREVREELSGGLSPKGRVRGSSMGSASGSGSQRSGISGGAKSAMGVGGKVAGAGVGTGAGAGAGAGVGEGVGINAENERPVVMPVVGRSETPTGKWNGEV